MKKSVLGIALVLAGCYPGNVLDKVNDLEFMEYLMKFDANGDHKISKQEAMLVTSMNTTFFKPMKSIKGVEYFENLEEFDVDSSEAPEMDLSKNKNLKKVVVRFNEQLTKLTVPNGLEGLHLQRVQALGSLRLKKMPSLEYLSIDCYRTYNHTPPSVFSEFSVQDAPKLKSLVIEGTHIKSIDLSMMPALEYLRCDNNEIEVLDVSNNPNISSLRCKGVKKIIMKEGQVIEEVNVNPNYKYIDRDVKIEYVK